MARPKRELTRITINLPSHLVSGPYGIDQYASKHGLTRTTAIVLLCADALAMHIKEQRKEEK